MVGFLYGLKIFLSPHNLITLRLHLYFSNNMTLKTLQDILIEYNLWPRASYEMKNIATVLTSYCRKIRFVISFQELWVQCTNERLFEKGIL